MIPPRVVVVGASIGGLTAAETLRQEGFDGEILILGDESHLPYTRPPLSKQILLGDWEAEQAAIRTTAELDDLGVQVRTGCTATGLDLDARTVQTTQGAVPFDELIIATGTAPRPHPLLPWAPTLRTMDDALRLRDRVRTAARIAVVGTGILGSEIASAARAHDAETLLIGRSGSLGFGGVGTQLTDELARLHEDNGVELALSTDIASSMPLPDGGSEITLGDGTVHRVDLAVAMIGGTPRTGWLASSGLSVADGIACDSDGIAAPGISAVGDVAAWADPETGRHVRVEHQSNAIEQAVAVAMRLANGTPAARPVPLFWSEIHHTRIHAYGWFDPRHPFVELTADAGARGTVYGSRDDHGRVHGVVGWNASPRDFRTARAAVLRSLPTLISQP